jgi:hypothetical protein
MMARPLGGSDFTISQLENMLNARRSKVDTLERARAKAARKLAAIEEKIRRLGGNGKGGRGGSLVLTAGGRARNEKSLADTMQEVLEKAGKPMTVGEIMQGILDTGYRSNSDSFRAIVNQTLIKER